METKNKKTTIAAISDIHVGESSRGEFQELFKKISSQADFVVICGDLTQRGTMNETEVLAEELKAFTIPVITVLGNHDFEAGQQGEMVKYLQERGIIVLQGEHYELQNVGIAGVKGFCGGFANYSLAAWGEKIIKDFVYEGVNEALKLENALQSLQTEHKIAIMHYSPIIETVANEPKEIYPFLGSTRLFEPLQRMGVKYVFHGHAHEGPHKFVTTEGVTVYNVCYSLLKKVQPEEPYILVTI